MSTERWEQETNADLVEAYWQTGRAECPDDGTELKDELGGGSDGYFLMLICPRCGKRATSSKASDPRAAEFRPWTDTEKAEALDRYFKRQEVRCPVDGARVVPNQPIQSDFTRIYCRRCESFAVHKVGRD